MLKKNGEKVHFNVGTQVSHRSQRVKSNKNPGKQFSGGQFSWGAYFRGVILRGAILSRAFFRGAFFPGAFFRAPEDVFINAV